MSVWMIQGWVLKCEFLRERLLVLYVCMLFFASTATLGTHSYVWCMCLGMTGGGSLQSCGTILHVWPLHIIRLFCGSPGHFGNTTSPLVVFARKVFPTRLWSLSGLVASFTSTRRASVTVLRSTTCSGFGLLRFAGGSPPLPAGSPPPPLPAGAAGLGVSSATPRPMSVKNSSNCLPKVVLNFHFL